MASVGLSSFARFSSSVNSWTSLETTDVSSETTFSPWNALPGSGSAGSSGTSRRRASRSLDRSLRNAPARSSGGTSLEVQAEAWLALAKPAASVAAAQKAVELDAFRESAHRLIAHRLLDRRHLAFALTDLGTVATLERD